MFSNDFAQSFEEQYPKPELTYTLPESLNKCPELKDTIDHRIKAANKFEVSYMDDNGVTYDILNRQYKTYGNPNQWHKMTQQGYDLIFDIMYKKYGGNISPKSFAFILDDLAEINSVLFEADLAVQGSSFNVIKAIAINQAWFKFCLQYPTNFEMNYDDYKKTIVGDEEQLETNNNITLTDDALVLERKGMQPVKVSRK